MKKKGITADPITGRGDNRSFRPERPPFRHRLPMNQEEKSEEKKGGIDLALERLDRIEKLVNECLELIRKEKKK